MLNLGLSRNHTLNIWKLPQALLTQLLSRINVRDQRVLLGPRIGEDADVLDFGNQLLVAPTDPVTFTTDLVGWYAVQINANDVACTGAVPRWFMATLLLPPSTTEATISQRY